MMVPLAAGARGDSIDRLLLRHPAVRASEVRELLAQATDTVLLLLGRRDDVLAEDLVALRLDVRAAAYPQPG